MKLAVLMFAVIIFTACGPSKEEIALREKLIRDSIDRVNEKAQLEIKLQNEKEKQQEHINLELTRAKETEKINNSPVMFLKLQSNWESGDFFNGKKLHIGFTNTSNRRIMNVKFVVKCYSKTDIFLGNYNDIIMDFIKPGELYNRNIEIEKLPSLTDKARTQLISAEWGR